MLRTVSILFSLVSTFRSAGCLDYKNMGLDRFCPPIFLQKCLGAKTELQSGLALRYATQYFMLYYVLFPCHDTITTTTSI